MNTEEFGMEKDLLDGEITIGHGGNCPLHTPCAKCGKGEVENCGIWQFCLKGDDEMSNEVCIDCVKKENPILLDIMKKIETLYYFLSPDETERNDKVPDQKILKTLQRRLHE